MKLNLPPIARQCIYLANVLGTPVMAYLLARGVIDADAVALWAAEMTAAFALAGLNTTSGDVPEVHGIDFTDRDE